jgi:hypothetical protein
MATASNSEQRAPVFDVLATEHPELAEPIAESRNALLMAYVEEKD